jgi:outer membrane protein OmpA-like peptidoglycan-associated protein
MTIFKPLLLISAVSLCVLLHGQTYVVHFDPPEKMDNSINSPAEESSPMMTIDGQVMFLVRTLSSENVRGLYGGQDIWYSVKLGDSFEKAENLSKVNNKGNNVIVGTAQKGNRLYFLNEVTRNRKNLAGLSRSDYNPKTKIWSNPQPVNIDELEVHGEIYGCYVDNNEKIALWSLPKKKNPDDCDLYISFSSDEGENWSKPFYLGDIVNSENDEISPLYDEKNECLFFSKNKKDNPADYDIYYSNRLDDSWTSWSKPMNARQLNSPKFDAYPHVDSFGNIYFSSNRSDTLSDIFKSNFFKAEFTHDKLAYIQKTIDVELPKLKILYPPTEMNLGSATMSNMADTDADQYPDLIVNGVYRLSEFDFDKSQIKPRHNAILNDLVDSLKNDPNLNLAVIGFTDSIGPIAYNLILSEKRAKAAMNYLVQRGISSSRIEVLGEGEKFPIASNSTAEGRARNRRVEIFFKKSP